MPDAPLIPVANAIAYELNNAASGTFNRSFEARVLWAKRTTELEDANVLHVDVGAVNWSQTMVDRGSWARICRYDIAVRKRFERAERDHTGEITDEEITELITLLDDLCGFFMPKQPSATGRKLSQVPEAAWEPEKNLTTDVMINWNDLQELHQFTGYFPLVFKVSA